MGVKVEGARFIAKITIKELESLTANDAGRILREDGNLPGRVSVRKDGVSVSFFYRYRQGEQNKEYAYGSHLYPARLDSTVRGRLYPWNFNIWSSS